MIFSLKINISHTKFNIGLYLVRLKDIFFVEKLEKLFRTVVLLSCEQTFRISARILKKLLSKFSDVSI